MRAIEPWLRFIMPEPNSGCWIWTGYVQGNGYGKAWFQGGKWLAHRLIYTLMVADIPDDHDLDHLCALRCCCNPDHLEPVLHLENMQRMAKRRRRASLERDPIVAESMNGGDWPF